jgi:hypothetical protein
MRKPSSKGDVLRKTKAFAAFRYENRHLLYNVCRNTDKKRLYSFQIRGIQTLVSQRQKRPPPNALDSLVSRSIDLTSDVSHEDTVVEMREQEHSSAKIDYSGLGRFAP